MNALARFEGFMQELMDRRVVRLLGGGLQPVELARAIGRCMEQSGRAAAAGPTVVPNRYRVSLHPEDATRFRRLDPALDRRLAQYAVELARERGCNFAGVPEVRLVEDAAVERGALHVQGEITASPERPPLWPRVGGRSQAPGSGGGPGLRLETIRDGRRISLDVQPLPFVIGRHEGCQLVLGDPRVSRRHAVIERLSGAYRVRDLGSRNGTSLNGCAVAESNLQDGDRLAIGPFEVTVRLDLP